MGIRLDGINAGAFSAAHIDTLKQYAASITADHPEVAVALKALLLHVHFTDREVARSRGMADGLKMGGRSPDRDEPAMRSDEAGAAEALVRYPNAANRGERDSYIATFAEGYRLSAAKCLLHILDDEGRDAAADAAVFARRCSDFEGHDHVEKVVARWAAASVSEFDELDDELRECAEEMLRDDE